MIARRTALLLSAAVLGAGVGLAQFQQRGGFRGPPPPEPGSGNYVLSEGSGWINEDTVRTARETMSHSTGTPNWTNEPAFAKDVFTLTRIIFKIDPNRPGLGLGRNFGRRLGWWVDYPDADLNFSYRLQQLTSAKTDPDARVLKLTDPALRTQPMIYMEHPGYMVLRDEEVLALRKYLLNGGVLFVNDFWSQPEWDGFAAQVQRVLPGRQWTELGTDHPAFHFVFPMRGPMNSFQVPTIQFWNPNHDPRDPGSRLQFRDRGEGSETMHVRAWHDDKGRIMVIATHNCDNGDGWERETVGDGAFFLNFSEKRAFPLGINIIVYAMTH